jgi:hypothetical protein
MSNLLLDNFAEEIYASVVHVGEKSEVLLCRLKDGVVFITGLTMLIFLGDTLMR